MDTEKLGRSRLMNFIFRPSGAAMESRLRHWLADPKKTLQGADLKPGQCVLEVGCGTGFFTMPAAEMIGKTGHLIAMDPLSCFIDRVSKKVRDANLKNVEILQRDALNTGLQSASIDVVLLFGVLPYATLPLGRLLPEMHRILKTDGTLAVWLFPPVVHGWVLKSILRSGLFTKLEKKNCVFNYKPVNDPVTTSH